MNHDIKRIQKLEDELQSVVNAAEVLIKALQSVPRNYSFDAYFELTLAIKCAKERAL